MRSSYYVPSVPTFCFVVRFSRGASVLALIGALGMGALLSGCDQVSRPAPSQPPSVSSLAVVPDSVNAAALPPSRIQDSVAQVPLAIEATARDPDGTVERVVFTIEPSSNPRGTASGTLEPTQGNRYRRVVGLGVPAFLDEVYTVRVYAVDDDSLASNQGIGRFRFRPAP
jgi:hypothetical protein